MHSLLLGTAASVWDGDEETSDKGGKMGRKNYDSCEIINVTIAKC